MWLEDVCLGVSCVFVLCFGYGLLVFGCFRGYTLLYCDWWEPGGVVGFETYGGLMQDMVGGILMLVLSGWVC